MKGRERDPLNLIPERRQDLLWETTPTGEVSVTIKQRSLFPIPQRLRKIVFDETGSYVLSLIDGRMTGFEIARILSEAKGLGIEQAEASLREFLKTLQSRGIITLRGGFGHCKACGADLPEGALYCPQCGTRQASEESHG
ncbi:PqqD family peptide modification chaperone [Candidatus Bathyarchaeota archaeon]|nr:PqqD family peptide modification chaperone [Candidatus Bathyarchaeota archaeon]MBS7627708.1 PqqD family peptide modification chaperone [Candidatus Bathyarchaeota archaeon]